MNRLELKRWRRQRRLTQPQLASLLGVDKMTVWRWESGDSTVPPFLELALERLDQTMPVAPGLADNRDRGYDHEDVLWETRR